MERLLYQNQTNTDQPSYRASAKFKALCGGYNTISQSLQLQGLYSQIREIRLYANNCKTKYGTAK